MRHSWTLRPSGSRDSRGWTTCVISPRFGDADDRMSADVRALLVAALRQLDIYDVAQPNPAPRLEESLQDGCDAPSVFNGVPE